MPTTFQQKIDFIASLTFDPRSVQEIEGSLGSAFTESVKKAAAIGGAKMTKGFIEGAERAALKMEASAKEIARMEADIARETDDTKKAALAQQYERDLKLHKRKLRDLKRTADLETKAHEKVIDRQAEMLKAYDDLVVNMKVDKSQLAKDMGEALSGAFGKISSGDLSGIVGSIAGAVSKGGGMMEAAGLAAGGAEAGGLASALVKLGPVLASVGATVGVIAVVLGMAYDQTKKYNQALVEGAGAGDFFAKGVGNMSASLNDMRDAVFGLGRRFRMDTEEIAKFTSALNASGITYKEFGAFAGRAASDQQAFFDVTKTAIVAAKGLGIEASDAAGFMDRSMRDLGKTNLEVRDAFGMIGDAAARSGMSVKSFFTAINETTSGMALHNIRLEDTIGLMLTMTKVLGEDLAKERAKLEGQFKNMGYTDRIKTVMTTGTGTTSKIVGADARAQAARTFGPALQGAISKVMPELVGATGVSIEKLGTMSEKQYRALVTTLRASDDANAVTAARQLDNLRDLARGAVRPGDELAQADAIGQLSKSGELAMQLASASAVLGEKGISSMEGLTRAAFEQITGMSGENFEVMKRLDRELRGQFDAVQEKVRLGTATEDEKKFAQMDFTEAVAAGFGKEEMEKGVRAGFTGMERMTESMLTESQSMATTLKNEVAFILEGIYGLIEWIVRFMGGDDQAAALDMQRAQMDALEEANEKSTATAQAINELVRKQASMGLSADEEAQLEKLQGEYKGLEVEKERLRASVDAFSRYSSPEAAMAMSKVEGAAAAVGAGGGGGALAEERASRAAAASTMEGVEANASLFGLSPTEDYWSLVLGTAAAGALAGGAGGALAGGVGAVPGAIAGGVIGAGAGAVAAFASSDEEQTYKDLQQGLGTGGAVSGVDLLAQASELTEEHTEASKDTLAAMLDADAKTATKDQTYYKKQADLLDKLLKEMQSTKETQALETLAGTGGEGAAAVAEFLKTGKKEALNVEALTASTDTNVTRALQNLGVIQSSPVNDFIYRGGAQGGVITPINAADQLLGMKPGGPVDRAARGGGGGTVVININGDTATIVRTVKDVLQKSGLTASPNNGFA